MTTQSTFNEIFQSILSNIDNGRHIELVKTLICAEDCTYQNARNEDHWTPLMTACAKNNLELAQYLLDLHADPNLVNLNHSNSCLQIAVDNQFRDITQLLLENQADASYKRPSNGCGPQYSACRNGDANTVALLLTALGPLAADELDSQDFEFFQTPLMVATKRSHVDIMQLQIKAKSNVNICTLSNQTNALLLAIEAATSYEHTLALQQLLNTNGVNLEHYNIQGKNALGVALEYDNMECVTLQLQHGADPYSQNMQDGRFALGSLFYYSNNKNTSDIINLSILPSLPTALFSAYDTAGRQLLHYALEQNAFREFLYMLTRSYQTLDDFVTSKGETVFELGELSYDKLDFQLSLHPARHLLCNRRYNILLTYLTAKGCDRCVERLQEFGIDPNWYAVVNELPLMVARKPKHIELLLRYKADPNIYVPHLPSHSVLASQSAEHARESVLVALIIAGADVNRVLPGQRTLLMHACMEQRILLVHLLLTHGADPNMLSTDSQETALMLAAKHGKHKVFEYLWRCIAFPQTLPTHVKSGNVTYTLPQLDLQILSRIKWDLISPSTGRTVLHYATNDDLFELQLRFPGTNLLLHDRISPFNSSITDFVIIPALHHLTTQDQHQLQQALCSALDMLSGRTLFQAIVEACEEETIFLELLPLICSLNMSALHKQTAPPHSLWICEQTLDPEVLYHYFFGNYL